MSPIDDELRAALHARASTVAPAPDPFSGVERRARRMRRDRVAASVAGTVLTVAAVAVAVPLVTDGPDRSPAPMATSGPTLSPEPPDNRFALDLADPWAYRGDRAVLADGNLETFAREWAVRHGVAPDGVRFVPLFGQVYEPSARPELVFAAQADGVGAFWGVVESTESGPEFVLEQPLAAGTTALPAALPGDEVARLLVVAAPDVADIQYGPDAASEWSSMTALTDGVAIAPLEGDPDTDALRVLGEDGEVVFTGPAPDAAVAPPGEGEGEGPGIDAPPQVDLTLYDLDPADPWEFRGDAEAGELLAGADEELFVERGDGRDDGSWSQRPLYAVKSESGVGVLVMLHTSPDAAPVVTTTWQRGDSAPEQSELTLEGDELLLQSTVATDLGDGTRLLVALASPRAGGIVLEQGSESRPDGIGDPGVGLWMLADDPPPGVVRLYTEGDGLLYHSEPARR